MLLAVELDGPIAADVYRRLMANGLVANAVTPSALRLAPPLNISNEHIDEGVAIIAATLAEVRAEAAQQDTVA